MSFAVKVVTADQFSDMLESCVDSREITLEGMRGWQMTVGGETVLAIQTPMAGAFNIIRHQH